MSLNAIFISHREKNIFLEIGKIRKDSMVPIIVVSKLPKVNSRIKVLDVGADDYISIPFVEGGTLC